MDEWSTSVWDTPRDPPVDALASRPPAFPDPLDSRPEPEPSFDDFDSFGEITRSVPEDDFGNDFGDFGDGQSGAQQSSFDDEDMRGFQEADRIQELPLQQPENWEPLRLDPLPPPTELAEDVQEILAPIWAHISPEEIMTRENIRQAEGLSQILVTQDSRTLHQTLFSVSPAASTHPPNWTRSRIRRQHLIALGIPINLDEVMPHANGKPLPALNITTRPSSAPPGPSPVPPSNYPSANVPRVGTPQPSNKVVQSTPSGLGPKPKLDETKIAEMLNLNSDTLPLLPLATLETHLNTLRTLTHDTSALLSYLLQTREALQQDSETYNGLIAELVGEAQKMKSGPKSKTGAGKRGSGVV